MFYYTKIKQTKEPQLYFSLLNFIKLHTWENIFMLITQGGTCIRAYPNLVMKSQRTGMQNHEISKKKNKSHNKGLLC